MPPDVCQNIGPAVAGSAGPVPPPLAAHAICHHRAEVSVLTGSRSPCFGIWTILTPVFTLAEETRPKSTLFWMDTKAVAS